MRKPLFVLLLFIFFFGCARLPTRPSDSRGAADGFLLSYRFAVGDQARYLLTSSFSSQSGEEGSGALSVNHEVEFRQDVSEVSPGGEARLSVVIERLGFVMSGPGREVVTYDSSDPQSAGGCPPEMRGIAFVVGKEIQLDQMPSGEIVRVTGLAAIYRSALARLPLTERTPVERFLRDMSHERRGLFGVGVVLPEGTRRLGEGWSAENGPFPIFCGKAAYHCDYVLREVSNGEAIVEFKGESDGGDHAAPSKMRRMRRVIFNGVFRFDLKKGILAAMHGESSSFIRIGESEQLRAKTTWDLTLKSPHS